MILSGFAAQLKSDRRMRENEVGINIVMHEGSDEVEDFYTSKTLLQRDSTLHPRGATGSASGACSSGTEGTAPHPRSAPASAPAGLPSGTQWNDPFLGFVNRHQKYVDDLTGQPLDPELCRIARKAELDYFRSKGVWSVRPIQEAWKLTGRPPISVRWVEVNKGDDENPKYRSRLVAREIRMAGEDAIFAPTPPLESLRMVLSYATTDFPNEPKKVYDPKSPHPMQVLAIDISRADFNAVTPEDEPTFVEFPPEFGAAPGMCGLLERHMYGTRRAADGWQEEYSKMINAGFIQGMASPCVFHHPTRNIVCSVYGDDFTAAGPKPELDWFEATSRNPMSSP